ncbi:hypothetical protein ACWD1Y_44985 [Streptomyces sp. NPDC002814]
MLTIVIIAVIVIVAVAVLVAARGRIRNGGGRGLKHRGERVKQHGSLTEQPLSPEARAQYTAQWAGEGPGLPP